LISSALPEQYLLVDFNSIAAMKIQITEYTERMLSEIGGYITEYRGKVMIKGKGEMSTYWLIDKEASGTRSLSIKSNVTFEENGGPSKTTPV
jgi:hypothetical protein